MSFKVARDWKEITKYAGKIYVIGVYKLYVGELGTFSTYSTIIILSRGLFVNGDMTIFIYISHCGEPSHLVINFQFCFFFRHSMNTPQDF